MFTNESIISQKHINNESERMLNGFQSNNQATLSRIACEISNAFTFIDSQIQLIRAHNPQLKNTQYWNQLSSDAKDFSQFLHDFSFYIHLEQLDMSNANLPDLLHQLFDTFSNNLLVKEQNLKLDISETSYLELNNYSCDCKKLKFAFDNILIWLAHISESDQTIHIKLPLTDDDFYSDNNESKYMKIVCSTKILPSIHDLYESVYQPQRKNNCVGTDLSVSIAHRIIHAHNGTITLESKDNLVTLTIYLPI